MTSATTKAKPTATRKPRIKSKRAKTRDVATNKNVRDPRAYQIARLDRSTLTQAPDETLRDTFIGLPEDVRERSVSDLNQLLVDTMMLRDLYKKSHWQLSGATFFQLHTLFDRHYREQDELVDLMAERVQLLGGVSIAMPEAVSERTRIPQPPVGREDPSVQITRLLDAHATILDFARDAAKTAGESRDVRTEDVIVGRLIATNEKQSWFVAEHSVPTQLQGGVRLDKAS